MTSELSKTISTCAVWIATAVILTFGLFRMRGEWFFFLMATMIISGSSLGATAVIWNWRPPPSDNGDHLTKFGPTE